MFFQGWVNGILIDESSIYVTLCIILLKTLKMRLYFSEIDRGAGLIGDEALDFLAILSLPIDLLKN